MKRIIHFFVFLVIIFFTACSSNKFITISDGTDCQTTIEGNFFAIPLYKYTAPAILFPKSNKILIRYGKVISNDENGVYFEKKKSGILDNLDTTYYKYDEIRAIVDSNRHCVWGQLDEDEKAGEYIKIELSYLEDPNYSPTYIELTPNKNFAYCVRPGNYEITNMYLDYPAERNDIYYKSVYENIARFEVKSGYTNYIGDIELLKEYGPEEGNFIVPYKKQYKGTSSAAVGGLLGGAIGGAISGAITSAANAEADSSGIFKFNIIHSTEYKSISNNKIEKSMILPIK